MTDALPDPLVFTMRALAARGALVEVSEAADAAVALLPLPLGTSLGFPEELHVATHPLAGVAAVACGIGSPLLERLSADARRVVPWVVTAPATDAPRVSHATALAGRVVVRNGLAEVVDAAVGMGVYARVTLAWAVEADDRYEGLFAVEVGPDRGEPTGLGSLLDVTARDDDAPPAHVDTGSLATLMGPLPGRATRALATVAREALESVERRHARDHARMAEYFAGLIAEVGSGRRKVDPAVRATRIEGMVAERAARLRDLLVRYTPKVTVAPVAVVFATLPVVRVRLRMRRRKLDREVRVSLPATSLTLDLLACDGCDEGTARPALCDDRLHLLCERCVTQAQGRFACAACGRPRPQDGLSGAR